MVKLTNAEEKVQQHAMFIIEMLLLDSDMVPERPSLIAATALYIAFRSVKNFSPWNAVMVKNTGYKETDLKEFGKKVLSSFERLK